MVLLGNTDKISPVYPVARGREIKDSEIILIRTDLKCTYLSYPIHPRRREACPIPLDRRRQCHQRFSRQRPETQHHRERRCASEKFPRSRRESSGTGPGGAKNVYALHGVHYHARHEARIQRPTTPWEPSQTRLHKLVVQLGRSNAEDRRRSVHRSEPVRKDMNRHENEGCIGSEAQCARKFAWLLGCGCNESPDDT